MFRKIILLGIALALSGSIIAGASSLTIDGLGRLPLGKDIKLVDGRGSTVETVFKENGRKKGYGKTGMAEVMQFFSTPPGMDLYPEKEPFPYDSLQMYQIHSQDVRGVYSAGVSVISGTEKELFHDRNKKAARFWETAFREDTAKPAFLFGLPKIGIDEYQKQLNGYLEGKGQKIQVRLISFAPWHAYKNGDGTYRWTQEAKAVITDERHLSFPLWIYTNMYRNKDTYYIITVQGSHTAADKLESKLLYALYGLERSGS